LNMFDDKFVLFYRQTNNSRTYWARFWFVG
jgi:hypothetical protein